MVLYQDMGKTFPIGLVIIPLFAAMSVLSIYEQINIPRVLVEVIERQGGVRDLFYALALPALLLIASKTANGVLKSGIMALGSRPMIYLYSVPINEKLFRIHYQMLTSPKVQSKLVKAKNIAFSGDGPGIHFFGLTVSNSLITFSTMMNRIREFLDVEDEVGEMQYGKCLERDVQICPSITFHNVGFRYPESSEWIFRNFNLNIRGGERLALVGINGAGKTTLMLMLMGLLHPTEGDILIDGISTFQESLSVLVGNFIYTAIGIYLVRNLFFAPTAKIVPLMNWGLNLGYLGLIFLLHYFAVKIDLKTMNKWREILCP